MIQRIQTVFLTIAQLLIVLVFCFQFAEIAVGETVYSFTFLGISDVQQNKLILHGWHIAALLSVVCMLQVVSIFLFKNRMGQMRLVIINLILLVGLSLVAWLFVRSSVNVLGEGNSSLKLPLLFPLVAAFFDFLAYRSILKDEKLVRSVDRIR